MLQTICWFFFEFQTKKCFTELNISKGEKEEMAEDQYG